jgi:hypothetical protein
MLKLKFVKYIKIFYIFILNLEKSIITQQKTLDLFTTLPSRISKAGYEQLQELHNFFEVGAIPNTLF